MDDGGINRHRQCKSDEMDQPYQHQSGDSTKYAETTIKMDEESAYQPRKTIQGISKNKCRQGGGFETKEQK